MKRWISLLLVLTMFLAVPVSGAEDYYEIHTVDDLLAFADQIKTDYDLNARLMADLDLSGIEWKPMGKYWTQAEDQRYSGEFDGNGYTIRNMTVRRVQQTDLGFFGFLGIGSYVHDLTLENIDIAVDPQKYGNYVGAADSTVGGIAADSDGVIENCHVSGKIYGVDVFQAGGIVGTVGYEDDIGIWDCTTDVEQTYEITEEGHTHTGYAEVGGIAGSSNAVIDNCHAYGDITLTGWLNSCGHLVGGVVGMAGYGDSTVRNSSNRGDIYGDVLVSDETDPSEPSYGGIAGVYHGDEPLTNCFNMGSITANAEDIAILVGGIVGDYQPGYSYKVHYDNCWSSGDVLVNDANGTMTTAGFRRDPDLRAYFVGEAAAIGSYMGQIVPENWLKDGDLTQILNENRKQIADNRLLPWEQTDAGPGLICVQVRKNPFVDVPFDAFYLDGVIWAVEQGITTGTSETTFSPNNTCQRAAVVTFLWRVAGCPEPTAVHNPFVDVKAGDFYYKAVLWAVEQGITTGTSGTTFSPMGSCNRAQVVTFLYRAMGAPAVSDAESPFLDVAEGQWYTAAVLWAVQQGITNGMGDGTFGINASCNRAQIVTFLYRAYAK